MSHARISQEKRSNRKLWLAEIDCWSCSVNIKDVNLEILHFKQFYKHFVFEKDKEGYVKKTQKNYMDVRVVLQLVW